MKLLARTTIYFLIYASIVAGAGTFVYYGFIRKIYYAYVDRTLSRRKLRVDRRCVCTCARLPTWNSGTGSTTMWSLKHCPSLARQRSSACG